MNHPYVDVSNIFRYLSVELYEGIWGDPQLHNTGGQEARDNVHRTITLHHIPRLHSCPLPEGHKHVCHAFGGHVGAEGACFTVDHSGLSEHDLSIDSFGQAHEADGEIAVGVDPEPVDNEFSTVRGDLNFNCSVGLFPSDDDRTDKAFFVGEVVDHCEVGDTHVTG